MISWSAVKNADGYDIFLTKCNTSGKKSVYKLAKTIKGNKKITWTATKLKTGTAYKAYVKAFVKVNGKKKYVKKSLTIHAITGGIRGKYTNPKSITVSKKKVTLKKNGTYKIKAAVNPLKKGKKLLPTAHGARIRYVSSNETIATVGKTGKVKARASGKCTIYVIAINGISKKITVTVK